MSSDSTEARLRKLENRLTYLTSAAATAGVLILAFLGFTHWQSIPSKIDSAIEGQVEVGALDRIAAAAAAAEKVIEADQINGVKMSFRWVQLKAELQGDKDQATRDDDSAIYLHILDDPSCFLVAMQLPTQDDNPSWLSGTGEQLVFGTTREVRTGQPSGNAYPRYRVSSNNESLEAVRFFSLVRESLTPVKLPRSVNFHALLSCPESTG